VIAALACSLPAPQAAAAGAFLHGLAADRWRAWTHSDRGMLARDISAEIPAVLGELLFGG
jgi:NAD(P)H-hydrate repair Nnr-like enzyme with NAD(P)H-hydrate dehydratase domain